MCREEFEKKHCAESFSTGHELKACAGLQSPADQRIVLLSPLSLYLQTSELNPKKLPEGMCAQAKSQAYHRRES